MKQDRLQVEGCRFRVTCWETSGLFCERGNDGKAFVLGPRRDKYITAPEPHRVQSVWTLHRWRRQI